MRKSITFLILALLAGAIAYYAYSSQSSDSDDTDGITVLVEKGTFSIAVSATGELQAERSEKILGPQGMRAVGIFQTTITDIVAEGTQVEEGGYVATLDRTELGNKMKTLGSDIDKTKSQLLQMELDTAIEMRGLRDQLVNLKFSMEEKGLEAKMNIYEAPAVQRQTKLELERLERDFTQAQQNYSLKQEQAQAKVQEINTTLEQHQSQMAMMAGISDEFVVKAPKTGMVIYDRSWNGKKGPGSRVTAWDPVVAQLPDLSDMVSITYVNEVDISKVKKDQEVSVSIDAFPDNVYTGKVLKIANIGEQRPNFDAKVFEVKIQINESDSILRPAMTTANNIVTSTFQEALFIPLECLHSNDSLSFVYTKETGKIHKREVISGLANDQQIIIKEGLSEGTEVSLTVPLNPEDIQLERLSVAVRETYERKKREQIEQKRKQAEADKKKMEEMKAKFKDMKGVKFSKK